MDPAAELADIKKRLTRLETYPSAITLVANLTTGVLNDVYPTLSIVPATFPATTSPGGLTDTSTPSFTVVRPVPVMCTGSMLMFTSGGSASYAEGFLVIADMNGNVVGCSSRFGVTNGEGAGDVTRVVVASLAAGTYIGTWTVFANVASSGTSFTMVSSEINVWRLPG
jgi:hypothetical protein